jgi:hypothetical protein
MNQIQDWGINELLTRRFNVTDSPGPSSTLAPEVMPVFQVAPPRMEDCFLRGERFARGTFLQANAALNYSGFRLYNPAGSGMLVIVDTVEIALFTDATSCYGAIVLGGATGTLTETMGTTLIDSRFRATATNLQSVAIGEFGFYAVPPGQAGPILFRKNWRTGEIIPEFPLGVVLSPGYAFDMFTSGVDQQLLGNITWHERTAQPSELG